MPLRKPLAEITEEDLRGLIGVASEGPRLDFKRQLPDLDVRSGKEELAKDVAAFANTEGGTLFYGIRDEQGDAVELVPLAVDDTDELERRLRQMLDDNLRPRLASLGVRPIPCADGHVLMIRVPRSWNAPHAVQRQTRLNFYTRNGTVSRAMDYDEIRDAFSMRGDALERSRRHIDDRLSAILDGDHALAVPRLEEPHAILQLLPLDAPGRPYSRDLTGIDLRDRRLEPPSDGASFATQWTFDGILAYTAHYPEDKPAEPDAYTLVRRDGSIECVGGGLFVRGFNPPWALLMRGTDSRLFANVARLIDLQSDIGVTQPIVVSIAFQGMRSLPCVAQPSARRRRMFDRELLHLPLTIIEAVEAIQPEALRYSLDALWNAAGYRRSESFNDAGEWINEPL